MRNFSFMTNDAIQPHPGCPRTASRCISIENIDLWILIVGSVFIIPVRLSKCTVPGFLISARETLADLQYVDLYPQKKWSDGVNRLLRSLRAARRHQ